jgi:hypothetical protein
MMKKADRTVINEEHQKQVKARKQHYQYVFGGEHGREVLDDLVSFTGFNTVVYKPGGNLHDIAFLEGQRAVVKYIIDQLEYKINYRKTDPKGS